MDDVSRKVNDIPSTRNSMLTEDLAVTFNRLQRVRFAEKLHDYKTVLLSFLASAVDLWSALSFVHNIDPNGGFLDMNGSLAIRRRKGIVVIHNTYL